MTLGPEALAACAGRGAGPPEAAVIAVTCCQNGPLGATCPALAHGRQNSLETRGEQEESGPTPAAERTRLVRGHC